MQVERDGIVQSEIFRTEGISLQHAGAEGNEAATTPPKKKAHLVGHAPAQAAEIRLRQLLEPQVRFLIDGKVKRIRFINERADVVDDAELDRGRALGCSQVSAQVRAGIAAKHAAHVN